MLKTELHRRLLDRYNENPTVKPLIDMWPTVEAAIEKVLKDGDYDAYVEAIQPYDEYIWEQSKGPESKSRPISIKKWKIYPSWSELNWAIVYERVRQQLDFKTVLIRTDKVLEGATTAGKLMTKDVDGGLAIEGKLYNKTVLFPVVVMEHKGGHFCKTACTGVNAIGRRFHDTNPNVITVQVTENNVSVGLEQTDGLINEIDIFVVDRGKNIINKKNNKTLYCKRNAEEMKIHEQDLLNKLNKANPNHFLNIKIENVSNKSFREQLNETNYISKEKTFIDIL